MLERRRRRTADTSRAGLHRLRFRLLQPEPHVHPAVHRRGGGEMLASLVPFAQYSTLATEPDVVTPQSTTPESVWPAETVEETRAG